MKYVAGRLQTGKETSKSHFSFAIHKAITLFVLPAKDVFLASVDDILPLVLVGPLHWGFLTFYTGISRVEKVKNGVLNLEEVDCTLRLAEPWVLKAFLVKPYGVS